MRLFSLIAGTAVAAVAMVGGALAQSAPPSYGTQITLEQAMKASAASIAEAKKINVPMAVSIVSPSGELIYFARMDDTQYGSTTVSQHKATSAARYRRTTKAFEDRVGSGGAGIAALSLDGMIASAGGNPIVVGGKVIGAIGVSGGTAAQDDSASQAGAAAVK